MKSFVVFIALLAATAASAQAPPPPALPISQTIPIARFGAKGDGVTDDSKAFAAAIAAAAKTGAELTLDDDKTYVLKDTLRILHSLKPIAIVGTGDATLLFAPNQALDSGILVDQASGVALKHFTLRGSAAGLHSGIKIAGSTNIQLENLTVRNITGLGISGLTAVLLAKDNQIWIANSTFENIGFGPGKPSFVIWNYYRERSQHIYITHNHFLNNTATIVIGLFDTDNSVVENNVLNQGNNCAAPCINNGYGILFYRAPPRTPDGKLVQSWPYPSNEIMSGNQITNTAGSGIYLAGVHGAKIVNNTITNSALRMNPVSLPTAGIALNWTTNATITDNTIDGSGQGGIALATTQDVLLERNHIHNAAKWGINLRVAQVRTTIVDNMIDGAPVGILSQQNPADTTYKNNVLTRVQKRRVDLNN